MVHSPDCTQCVIHTHTESKQCLLIFLLLNDYSHYGTIFDQKKKFLVQRFLWHRHVNGEIMWILCTLYTIYAVCKLSITGVLVRLQKLLKSNMSNMLKLITHQSMRSLCVQHTVLIEWCTNKLKFRQIWVPNHSYQFYVKHPRIGNY